MAWSFVAQTSNTTNGSTLPLNVPTHASGDLLVAFVSERSSGASTPSGWTLVRTIDQIGFSQGVWYRTASGSEPASYEWNDGGPGSDMAGVMLSYRDVDTTPDTSNGQTDDVSGTTITAPTVTPSEAGSLVIVGLAVEDSDITIGTPSGTTSRATAYGSGSTTAGLKVCDYTHGNSATGSKTATHTGGTALDRIGVQVVFNLSASAPDAPTLGTPAAAASSDLAAGQAFTWTHNDPQSDAQTGYRFRRKNVTDAGSYEYWNAGTSTWGTAVTNSTSTQSVTFPASKWTSGKEYVWSVATEDATGLGVYASDRTVYAQRSLTGVPKLGDPGNNESKGANPTTFEGAGGTISYSWTEGDGQSKYRLRRQTLPDYEGS